ncbi:MAG TPA: hypothetical protein VHH34_09445, partial [Pseudonocardiaceae bacterium]|nr:hypothetical protein [Pseudonocardiaceae bacterium]
MNQPKSTVDKPHATNERGEPLCELTELVKLWCAHCRTSRRATLPESPIPQDRDEMDVVAHFPARWPGICGQCG